MHFVTISSLEIIFYLTFLILILFLNEFGDNPTFLETGDYTVYAVPPVEIF